MKAAKNMVTVNTTSSGALDTDKFLCANMACRNSAIYPKTGKMIAQSLMGRHLRGALPAVKEFYQVKCEYIMERKQRELVAAKRVQKMEEAYNKGSKDLPKLAVRDKVRVQNQTMVRTRDAPRRPFANHIEMTWRR